MLQICLNLLPPSQFLKLKVSRATNNPTWAESVSHLQLSCICWCFKTPSPRRSWRLAPNYRRARDRFFVSWKPPVWLLHAIDLPLHARIPACINCRILWHSAVLGLMSGYHCTDTARKLTMISDMGHFEKDTFLQILKSEISLLYFIR